MDLPFGVPYTLDQAYPFIKDALILFGFPDIIFQPEDAFTQLLDRQAETDSDIVLGLFPVNRRHRGDRVALDDKGWIKNTEIDPKATKLKLTWIIAVISELLTIWPKPFELEFNPVK